MPDSNNFVHRASCLLDIGKAADVKVRRPANEVGIRSTKNEILLKSRHRKLTNFRHSPRKIILLAKRLYYPEKIVPTNLNIL